MSVRLAPTASAGSDVLRATDGGSARWRCALVNNMPDGAFDATERQYLDLLATGSRADVIEVTRHTMVGVPRGERTASRIAAEYRPVADIYDHPPDLLIVTGSNPIEPRMSDELYWADLVQLLLFAHEHVDSLLLSCLSAHAALAVYDGIERVRLPTKCTGVFPQHVEIGDPLTAGLESEVLLPHSRWNTSPHEAIAHAGYRIVIHSDVVGWSVAAKEDDGRRVVLVQGHPEYDPSSLLREYRRDAGRYVHRERDDLPYLPFHCVSHEDWGPLEQLHHEIIQGSRDPVLIDTYPFDEVGSRAPWPWHEVGQRFYTNWLTSVQPGRD